LAGRLNQANKRLAAARKEMTARSTKRSELDSIPRLLEAMADLVTEFGESL